MVSFDRVSVKFLDSVSRSTIDSLNISWHVTIVDSIPGLTNYYVLKVTHSTRKSVLEIANIYEQDIRTEFAVPDYLANISLQDNPSDPFFYYQYNFHNTGQTGGAFDADIDAPEAWEFGLGATDLVIAVIDEGVEVHEDLPSEKLF